MNPKQFKEFLRSNEEATGKAVNKFVNGKLDLMTLKLDTHIKALEQHVASDLKYQEKIDGNIVWVVRLIVGAVILGVVGMIIK